jgi:multimeric flavodoxin WrbA
MEELKATGIECEYVWIGREKLQGCIACGECIENDDQKCTIQGDNMNEYIKLMLESDGIIIGSPTYFSDLTTSTKALIERAGFATRRLLKNKLGAAVVAVRRAGANHVFSSINYFFLIKEMIVVGSTYWNLGIGSKPGEVLEDEEGVITMKNLGKNFASVLIKLLS